MNGLTTVIGCGLAAVLCGTAFVALAVMVRPRVRVLPPAEVTLSQPAEPARTYGVARPRSIAAGWVEWGGELVHRQCAQARELYAAGRLDQAGRVCAVCAWRMGLSPLDGAS